VPDIQEVEDPQVVTLVVKAIKVIKDIQVAPVV
jgi:ribosome-binding factor A